MTPPDAHRHIGGHGGVVGDVEVLHRLPDGLHVVKGRLSVVADENRHKSTPPYRAKRSVARWKWAETVLATLEITSVPGRWP